MRIWRWAPARRRGVEILDDAATPDAVRLAAMQDLPRANALFGGTRAVLGVVQQVLPRLGPHAVLVDVGTGTGDVPARLRAMSLARGLALQVIGVDTSIALLRAHQGRFDAAVAGDALRLPIRDGAADVVVCSQLLHHFVEDDARAVIAELHRVSRGWVVIADLRRSHLAAAGFWLASRILRFHPVTRRDGVTSVYRGFTARELAELVRTTTGIEPTVRIGVFWRISVRWRHANDADHARTHAR